MSGPVSTGMGDHSPVCIILVFNQLHRLTQPGHPSRAKSGE